MVNYLGLLLIHPLGIPTCMLYRNTEAYPGLPQNKSKHPSNTYLQPSVGWVGERGAFTLRTVISWIIISRAVMYAKVLVGLVSVYASTLWRTRSVTKRNSSLHCYIVANSTKRLNICSIRVLKITFITSIGLCVYLKKKKKKRFKKRFKISFESIDLCV